MSNNKCLKECLVCLEERVKLYKCYRCNAIVCIKCYKNIKIRSCLVCKLDIFNKELDTKYPIKDKSKFNPYTLTKSYNNAHNIYPDGKLGRKINRNKKFKYS